MNAEELIDTARTPIAGDKGLPMPQLLAKLGSSPHGLSQAEAQKRLTQYRPNEIAEKKTNEFLKFLSYFWGPIPWMIEAAVILSAVARHWPDFGIILLLPIANAVVGFWEEHQAGNAIAALKAKLAVQARIQRDGKWVTPPTRELVPGAGTALNQRRKSPGVLQASAPIGTCGTRYHVDSAGTSWPAGRGRQTSLIQDVAAGMSRDHFVSLPKNWK
jgi:hypothetical protein